jgi:hypothetical protein
VKIHQMLLRCILSVFEMSMVCEVDIPMYFDCYGNIDALLFQCCKNIVKMH